MMRRDAPWSRVRSGIGNNLLTGSISEASFFECKSVAVFDIPSNYITGTIPQSVGFMTNLEQLYAPSAAATRRPASLSRNLRFRAPSVVRARTESV